MLLHCPKGSIIIHNSYTLSGKCLWEMCLVSKSWWRIMPQDRAISTARYYRGWMMCHRPSNNDQNIRAAAAFNRGSVLSGSAHTGTCLNPELWLVWCCNESAALRCSTFSSPHKWCVYVGLIMQQLILWLLAGMCLSAQYQLFGCVLLHNTSLMFSWYKNHKVI